MYFDLAFSVRTDEEHRHLGDQYRHLTTKTERAKFVKAHATRFTQFSRLPYFDTVRQIVIDPMHNLLLGKALLFCIIKILLVAIFVGLVKTHFYHIWVQNKILREKHELRVLHEMLADVRTNSCGPCLLANLVL